MTKIKFCGLRREQDIKWANEIRPDYAGMVFVPKSKRYVTIEQAARLRSMLDPGITAVGVFVNEAPEAAASVAEQGIIDVIQLHGQEDEEYIQKLRSLTNCPVFQAFRMDGPEDAARANRSSADMVLLDAGSGGTGTVFDWNLLESVYRPYILAGGLNLENAEQAVRRWKPWGVDVSSGIETEGIKDREKMADFARRVRGVNNNDE